MGYKVVDTKTNTKTLCSIDKNHDFTVKDDDDDDIPKVEVYYDDEEGEEIDNLDNSSTYETVHDYRKTKIVD
jgi:hypothetical protein